MGSTKRHEIVLVIAQLIMFLSTVTVTRSMTVCTSVGTLGVAVSASRANGWTGCENQQADKKSCVAAVVGQACGKQF